MLITLLYKNDEIGCYDTVSKRIVYNDRYYQLIDKDPSIKKLASSLNAFFAYSCPEGRQLQLFKNNYIQEIKKGNFPWLSESSNFSLAGANTKKFEPVPRDMPVLAAVASDIPPELFAAENAWKRRTAPVFSGFRDKFPAFMTYKGGRWLITSIPPGYTGNIIVKPATPGGGRFPNMPENEYIFMQLAGRVGLTVPRTWLCYDASGEIHYAVERFGIYRDAAGRVYRENMADFLGLMGLDSRDKYAASLERFFGAASQVLTAYDFNMFARAWYYGVLVGNTDQHPKNFSVFVRGAGRVKLAPVYDIVHMLCYGKAPPSCLKFEGQRGYPDRGELERFILGTLSQQEVEELKTCVYSNVTSIVNNTFRLAGKIRKLAGSTAGQTVAEVIKSRIIGWFN